MPILYCTVLYYTKLYYTMLYYTIPYHTIPYHTTYFHKKDPPIYGKSHLELCEAMQASRNELLAAEEAELQASGSGLVAWCRLGRLPEASKWIAVYILYMYK